MLLLTLVLFIVPSFIRLLIHSFIHLFIHSITHSLSLTLSYDDSPSPLPLYPSPSTSPRDTGHTPHDRVPPQHLSLHPRDTLDPDRGVVDGDADTDADVALGLGVGVGVGVGQRRIYGQSDQVRDANAAVGNGGGNGGGHGDGEDPSNNVEKLSEESIGLVQVIASRLRKVYPNGKRAVQEFSVAMVEGQITCLLGHNTPSHAPSDTQPITHPFTPCRSSTLFHT